MSGGSEERGPLRLPRTRRYTLYVISIGVFATGALWLIYHYFMGKEGPFGIQKHPLEVVWLQTHGIISAWALWMFGVLWPIHVLRGWNMRWRRWSGGAVTAAIFLLGVTGLGLYYIESREIREMNSIVHWVIGLIVLVLFFIHWLSKSTPHRDKGPYPWPWFRKRHPVGGEKA